MFVYQRVNPEPTKGLIIFRGSTSATSATSTKGGATPGGKACVWVEPLESRFAMAQSKEGTMKMQMNIPSGNLTVCY